MSLKEKKLEYLRTVRLYGIDRRYQTIYADMVALAYEEGYRDCAKEIRDIVYPEEGRTEAQNSWLSDLVDLIQDLVVDKKMEPLEPSQYDKKEE